MTSDEWLWRPSPSLMKLQLKFIATLIALGMAPCAFAAEHCVLEGKHCQLDPFAPGVLAYGILCSEIQPENTAYYRAIVDAVFFGHRKEYSELKADPDFQRTLRSARKAGMTIPKSQKDIDCHGVLLMGKAAIEENAPLEKIADFGVMPAPKKTIAGE